MSYTLDIVVAAAFILQIYNLRELGRGRIHYLLMVGIYSLFAVAEAWVAIVDQRNSYWLFVGLSTYGALQGVKGHMTKPPSYTLEELANLVSFNKSFLKVVTKKLGIDSTAPIRETDAARIAEKLKRPWPPAL